MNRGIKHDHVHCTAGELLALQPTDVTIPWTMRKSILGLDFDIHANNWSSIMREFRHVMGFPAPTQLITVSQQNTPWQPLLAVVTHCPRSFSAVWIYARCWTCTAMLSNCVVSGSAKDIRQRGRDSGNALEVGNAIQSSVLSLITFAPATPVIINYWHGRDAI